VLFRSKKSLDEIGAAANELIVAIKGNASHTDAATTPADEMLKLRREL